MATTQAEVLIPSPIYCPKCGKEMPIKKIELVQPDSILDEGGYIAVGQGVCRCGVVCTILRKPLPEHPTFTILIDVYEYPQKKP